MWSLKLTFSPASVEELRAIAAQQKSAEAIEFVRLVVDCMDAGDDEKMIRARREMRG